MKYAIIKLLHITAYAIYIIYIINIKINNYIFLYFYTIKDNNNK
jgi:hypothetical protein